MSIVTRLVETRQETERFFNLPANDLLKTYSSGKWSTKKILVHLSDAEGVLLERVKRIIAEPRQVIWAFNQDLWCANLDYENYPLDISKSLYIAGRNSAIYLAEKYYDKFSSNEFVHNETGVRTLK